ncbi:hypothetical protein [Leuconostoc pseudomesenteroides]|uniref:hypothetical protein n=1 Tax=Leuconostoc pseudomesenteroides TaxID=33968 RepID=UPI0039E77FA8
MGINATNHTRLFEYTHIIDLMAASDFWTFAAPNERTAILFETQNGTHGIVYSDDSSETGYQVDNLDLVGKINHIRGGFTTQNCLAIVLQLEPVEKVSLYRLVEIQQGSFDFAIEQLSWPAGTKGLGVAQSQTDVSNFIGYLVETAPQKYDVHWYNTGNAQPRNNGRSFTNADFSDASPIAPFILRTGNPTIPVNGYLFASQSRQLTDGWYVTYQQYDNSYQQKQLKLPDGVTDVSLTSVKVADTKEKSCVVFSGKQANRLVFLVYQVTAGQFDSGQILLPPVEMDGTFNIQTELQNDQTVFSIIARDTTNTLSHVYLADDEHIWYPLAESVVEWSAHQCNQSTIGVIFESAETNLLQLLTKTEVTGDWLAEQFIENKAQSVVVAPVYETQLMFCDDTSLESQSATVNITGPDNLRVIIDDKHYALNHATPLEIQTNQQGKLSIMFAADTLAQPALTLDYTSGSETGQIKIDTSLIFKDRFGTLRKEDLLNACDADGQYILAADVRDNPNQVEEVVRTIKPLVNTELAADVFANGAKAFSLDYTDGRFRYQVLTKEAMTNIFAGAQSITGFWSSIGDFFRSVSKKFVQVVSFVAEKVVDGVNAVIQIVIDGATKSFSFLQKTFPGVMKLVETVFNMIKMPFEKLFEWLSDLVGWSGIKRTQRAIKVVFNRTDILTYAVGAGHAAFIQQLDALSTTIDDTFNYIKSSAIGNKNSQSYLTGSNDNPLDNYIWQAAVQNMNGGHFTMSLDARVADDILVLYEQLKTQAVNYQAKPEFKKVEDEIQDLVLATSASNSLVTMTFSQILTIVQALCQLTIDFMKVTSTAVSQLIQQIIDLVKTFLNQTIQVPILTSLFETIFDQQLTVVNLVSLMLAFGVNIASKIGTGHVPFENDDQVTGFQNYFTNLNPNTRQHISEDWTKFLKALSAVCQTAYYVCLGVSDVTDEGVKDSPSIIKLDRVAWIGIGINLIWVLITVPWIYDSDPFAGFIVAWGACAVGLAFDFVMQCVANPDSGINIQNEDVSCLLSSIAGFVYLGGTVASLVYEIQEKTADVLTYINEFILSISSFCRFLFISGLPPQCKIAGLIMDNVQLLMGIVMIFASQSDEQDENQSVRDISNLGLV